MNNELTAKEIIELETFRNPFCGYERVLALPKEAYCIFEFLVREDEICLNAIRVAEDLTGRGIGTAGLDWLKSVSERTRAIITGQIEPCSHKKLDVQALRKFYKKNGFMVDHDKIVYFPKSLYTNYKHI